MADLLTWLERFAKLLSFLVVSFFFGGGLNLTLYMRVDAKTGLGLEEALYLLLAFGVYCSFVAFSYTVSGKSYTDRPQAIFEMTDIKVSKDGAFQGPRFRNTNEGETELTDTKAGKHKRKKKLKPNKDKNRGGSRRWTLDFFNLEYVMKAGFRGGRISRGDMTDRRTWRRATKYHVFNFLVVCIPFVFMLVPLVPCWLRESHGVRCSANGTPSAIFILTWNCLTSFLFGVHFAGMLLTAATLLSHCEGMARVMRDLVSQIETIDQLEGWHTTMWRLHRHMNKKIRPFKALIVATCAFAVLFTLAAVALGISHFSVHDKEEINEMESAWIQLVMCATAFAVPGVLIFAFAAQINSGLSKAVERLDAGGSTEEISLAEYFTTVIEHWRRRKKGFMFCGIHVTDLTCFYFTVGLAVVGLTPILYAGSF
mmetsp:Transcript_10023/g.19231  ORF Transcript_10023/g.19231 Transcript_10023/m.19231 type:complete len:425 (-) Transcript_10023:115-1389(-)